MSAIATCPHCATDQAHATHAVALTCAVCGKPFALEKNGAARMQTISCDNSQVPSPPPTPDLAIADNRFQVIEEINRGGMGIVLRGRDAGLNREVAIKVIRDHRSPIQQQRFIKEAQITGQLEHPNIVPVHEFGTDTRGRHYFAMKLVRGRTLASIIAWHRSDPQEATREYPLSRMLGMLVQVCNAVAFSHARGVIHRDIKPSNIMVGDFGEVMLMDWGLAKVGGAMEAGHGTFDGTSSSKGGSTATVEKAVRIIGLNESTSLDSTPVTASPDSDMDLTHDGSIIGTPVYMSPEQAAGRGRDMDARSDVYALGALLYEILTLHAPVSGADLKTVIANAANGAVRPPELRTPERDIPKDLSAVAMKSLSFKQEDRYPSALAMRRDLESYLEGRTVTARNEGVIDLGRRLWRRQRLAVIASLAVLVVVLGAAVTVWITSLRAQRQSEAERVAAVAARSDADQQRRIAEEAKTRSESAFTSERILHRQSEEQAHLASIALAGEQITSGDIIAARAALDRCPVEYRDWAWRRLDLLCHQHLVLDSHTEPVMAIAVSADGSCAAAGNSSGTVVLYDTATHARRAERHILPGRIRALTVSGNLIACGGDDTVVRLWNGADDVRSLAGTKAAITALALASDGRHLVSGATDGSVRVWTLPDGPARILGRLPDEVTILRCDETGVILAAAIDGTVARWNADGRQTALAQLGRRVLALAPQGDRALVNNEHGAEVVELAQGKTMTTLRNITRPPLNACFLDDGLRLVGGGDDGVVRMWEATTGRELLTLRGHGGRVTAVAVRPSGPDRPVELLSSAEDATLRFWDGERRRDVVETSIGSNVVAAAIHPGGRCVLVGTATGSAAIWDLVQRRPMHGLILGRRVRAVAFAPDGLHAAAAGDQGACRIWSTEDGRTETILPCPSAAILAVAFSPEGKRLATATGDGSVRIWDISGTREQAACRGHTGAATGVAWSPDGNTIASTGTDGTVRLFNSATGVGLRLLDAGGVANAVTFNADGTMLAVATDRSVNLIETPSGNLLVRLRGHTGTITGLRLIGNDRLLSNSADGTVRLWGLPGGQCLMVLRGSDAPIIAAQLASDGALLVTASDDGSIRAYPASR